ncbi:NAD(P)H-binding protein [Carboxylicivirga sediminis]|uniref:NAD(P)H-binding protein n=1 Tax=Carboxylicivirga sediminis TaxID=2006564 RepID=A0A941J135_9BACT|nr:NAD(P)-binding oxidoreductase [Carboxylicivirga sediminis]MBR8538349.1 NAD(P)H-binding protein [Carboxylicivirga sediminis]
MKTLVIGASGATGLHLVQQLLEAGQAVKIIVRSTAGIPAAWQTHEHIEIITASIAEMHPEQMVELLKDCQSVASCLGHRPSFKGIYGKPRRLVRDAVQLICECIQSNAPASPVKFVLMNTSGNANRDLNEPNPLKNRIVIGLLRVLIPPHPDNEQAADYLRVTIGQDNPYIQWVAVRPDGLINEDEVTDYELFPSPVRNPIFNPGKTSRINVANCMARLIAEPELWDTWKGQMPLVYNKEA